MPATALSTTSLPGSQDCTADFVTRRSSSQTNLPVAQPLGKINMGIGGLVGGQSRKFCTGKDLGYRQ